MALTVLTNPSNYQLSKNPVVLQLSTDSYKTSAGTVSSMVIIASGTNAVDGILIFVWNTGSVTFTVKVTPDGSGNQIRSKGSHTDEEYGLMVIEDMEKNYIFSETFNLIALSGGAYAGGIGIVSKQKGVDFDLYVGFSQTDSGFVKDTIFRVIGTDPVYSENYKMKADVWLETLLYADDFVKVGTQDRDPLDNKCKFDFQDELNGNLSYDFPTYSQTAPSICYHVLRRFYIRYFEKYGNPVLPQKVEQSTTGYILKAGVVNRDFVGTTKLLESKFQTPGKFLTGQPRTKKVSSAQKEFLYGYMRLKITISLKNHKDDIVVDGITVFMVPYSVILFPSGFTQLNLIAHATFEDIINYTVEVIHVASGDILSEKFTYVPDLDYYIDEHYFLFSNSNGGADTVRFTGVKETAFEIEKETVQRTMLFDTSVTTAEYADVNHLVKDKFKHASGFITKDEADWLEDLFIAEQKFIIAEGKFIPISISTISHGKYNSQTGKTFYELEYSYAETNPVIK